MEYRGRGYDSTRRKGFATCRKLAGLLCVFGRVARSNINGTTFWSTPQAAQCKTMACVRTVYDMPVRMMRVKRQACKNSAKRAISRDIDTKRNESNIPHITSLIICFPLLIINPRSLYFESGRDGGKRGKEMSAEYKGR